MEKSRLDYYGRIQPNSADLSNARRLQKFAELTAEVGGFVSDVAQGKAKENVVKQAVEDAATESVKAAEEGRAPELKEGFWSQFGNYSKAYNDVVQQAYAQRVKGDIRAKLDTFQLEADGDAEQFEQRSKGYLNGLLKTLDPETAMGARLVFNEQYGRSLPRVAQIGRQRTRERAKNDIIAGVNSDIERAEIELTAGDVAAGEQSLAEALVATQGLYDSNDIDRSTLDDVIKRKDLLLTTATPRREIQVALDNNDFDAARKALIAPKRPESVSIGDWEQWLTSTNTKITRAENRFDAANQAATEQLEEDVKNYVTAVSSGFLVDSAVSDQIETQVANSGDEDLIEIMNVAKLVSNFSVMSNADRNNYVTNLTERAEGDLDQVPLLDEITKAQVRIARGLSHDAKAFAQRQGIIETVDIDPADPSTIVEAARQSKIASAHYGQPVPAFTNREAQLLGQVLETGTVDQQLNLFAMLNQDPASLPILAKTNPTLAAIAATKDEDVQRRIITGRKLQEGGEGAKQATLPSRQLTDKVIEDVLGPVNEVYGPENRAMVIKMAQDYYVSDNPNAQQFDRGAFEDALEAVTGGIGEINGGKFQLPRSEDGIKVTEDEFETFINYLTPEDIEEFGGVAGSTDPEEALALIQSGQVVSDQNNEGMYFIYVGEVGQVLANRNGTPFTFAYDDRATTRTSSPAYSSSRAKFERQRTTNPYYEQNRGR